MYRKLYLILVCTCAAISSYAQYNYNNSTTVSLYEDCNYSGRRYNLGVGSYRANAMGVRNDKLSSLQVPFGFKVTIYENDKFQGRANTYTADAPCLDPNWRQMASSIVIERQADIPANATPNDGVTFYYDCYGEGYSQTFKPGNYTGAQLGQLAYNISSFTIHGDLAVKLYINSETLGGVSADYQTSVNCLPKGQNDKIGSLIIEYRKNNTGFPATGNSGNGNNNNYNDNSGYATFYADCNYSGNALRLQPGTYEADKLGVLRNTISSVEIPSNLRVRAYTGSYVSGNGTLLTGNTTCLSNSLNNSIGALVVESNSGGYGNNNGGYNNPNDPYNSDRVVLYTDADFKGQSVELYTGTWYKMSQANFPDNALSSIRVPAGYKVVIYEDENARGNSLTITTSRNSLSSLFGSWNDKASSLVITRE